MKVMNELGIGANPTSPFTIAGNYTGNTPIVNIGGSISSVTTGAQGIAITTGLFGSGSGNVGAGLLSNPTLNGTAGADYFDAIQAKVTVGSTLSGTVQYVRGISIQTPQFLNSGGSVWYSVGLNIDDQVGASGNYAIKTGLGINVLGDSLAVGGAADRIQLQVKSYSSQTQDVFRVLDKISNPMFGVTADGRVYAGAGPVTNVGFNVIRIYPGATGSDYGMQVSESPFISANTNYSFYGESVVLSSANIGSYSIGAGHWIAFDVLADHAGSATMSDQWGINVLTQTSQSLAGGTVSRQIGVRVISGAASGSVGSIGTVQGIYISNMKSGSGSITNNYGLYIDNMAGLGSTLNYSIWTGTGTVHHDGMLEIGNFGTAIASTYPFATLGSTTAGAAGMFLINNDGGTGSDVRLSVFDNAKDQNIAFVVPSTGNTAGALFGLARTAGCFILVNSVRAGTDRALGLGTVHQAMTVLGAYNTEVVRLEATGSGSGPKIGFLGHVSQALPMAYTQTYSTATRTHSALTAATLTDTYGTGSTTIADVGSSHNQTTLNNIVRSLANQINALVVDMGNTKQVLNQIIDDLQGYGLLQ